MEIVVSTTIFAVVLTMMLVLFSYTLRINRKVEGLRQVSQATRNFTEFIVREIRNGSIDYSGTIDAAHCTVPYNASSGATFLALVNRAGDRECFYLVANGINSNLWLTKLPVTGGSAISEQVNPVNVTIDASTFRFFVRPTANPQIASGGFYPGVQPFVTIVMNLSASFNSIEQPSVIPYQTSVSTDNYSIQHH